MNEKYYVVNNELKKKLLKKYVNNQVGYKKWGIISNILKISPLFIISGVVIITYVSLKDLDTLLIGILAVLIIGVVFSFVTFGIGHVIKNHGVFIYGQPYIVRNREYLIISDNEVKLGYHYLEDTENNDSIDVYQIPRENMNAVIYNPEYHFVRIIGEARLISYDDIQRTIINEKNSQRKFYSNSPFEIMLAFDEEEEIVKLLKGMAKNSRDE